MSKVLQFLIVFTTRQRFWEGNVFNHDCLFVCLFMGGRFCAGQGLGPSFTVPWPSRLYRVCTEHLQTC